MNDLDRACYRILLALEAAASVRLDRGDGETIAVDDIRDDDSEEKDA